MLDKGLALLLALGLAACTEAGQPAEAIAPETLTELVPALVQAIAAKDSEFVVRHVALEFRERGGLNYFDLRALAESYALRDEEIGARLESFTLDPPTVDGQQSVRARVLFALGHALEPTAGLPPNAIAYALEVRFARNPASGLWQAVGGSYRREAGPSSVPGTPPMSSAAPD